MQQIYSNRTIQATKPWPHNLPHCNHKDNQVTMNEANETQSAPPHSARASIQYRRRRWILTWGSISPYHCTTSQLHTRTQQCAPSSSVPSLISTQPDPFKIYPPESPLMRHTGVTFNHINEADTHVGATWFHIECEHLFWQLLPISRQRHSLSSPHSRCCRSHAVRRSRCGNSRGKHAGQPSVAKARCPT